MLTYSKTKFNTEKDHYSAIKLSAIYSFSQFSCCETNQKR